MFTKSIVLGGGETYCESAIVFFRVFRRFSLSPDVKSERKLKPRVFASRQTKAERQQRGVIGKTRREWVYHRFPLNVTEGVEGSRFLWWRESKRKRVWTCTCIDCKKVGKKG